MKSLWIRKVVTAEQLARIKQADKIELRLELDTGEVCDSVVCYTEDYIDREYD